MSYLSQVDPKSPHTTHPEENLISKTLPLELFDKVLSHLNNALDIQSATLVSRTWKWLAIEAAKFKESHLMREWVETLCAHLEQTIYSARCEFLRKTLKEAPILEDSNLKGVKQSLLFVREKMLQVLRALDFDCLENLGVEMEGVKKYSFFGEIIKLDKINREIIEVSKLPNSDDKQYAQQSILGELTQLGQIDPAIEIAKEITDKYLRALSLKEISANLTQNGNIDKALEVANLISLKELKTSALENIYKALVENSEIKRAIEVADTLPVESDKRLAFRKISIQLERRGDIEGAVEVASKISDERTRRAALKNVFKTLETDEMDRRYLLK